MLFHKCGQPILFRNLRAYYGQPVITQNKIKLIAIISEEECTNVSLSLYCNKCKEEITEKNLEELKGYCSFCKRTFPIKQLWIPSKTGGVYCKEHLEEFYSDERASNLFDIAKKIS